MKIAREGAVQRAFVNARQVGACAGVVELEYFGCRVVTQTVRGNARHQRQRGGGNVMRKEGQWRQARVRGGGGSACGKTVARRVRKVKKYVRARVQRMCLTRKRKRTRSVYRVRQRARWGGAG